MGATEAQHTYSLYLRPIGQGTWKSGIAGLKEALEAQEDAKQRGFDTLLEADSPEADALLQAYYWDAASCGRRGVEFSWETFKKKWEDGDLKGKRAAEWDFP